MRRLTPKANAARRAYLRMAVKHEATAAQIFEQTKLAVIDVVLARPLTRTTFPDMLSAIDAAIDAAKDAQIASLADALSDVALLEADTAAQA